MEAITEVLREIWKRKPWKKVVVLVQGILTDEEPFEADDEIKASGLKSNEFIQKLADRGNQATIDALLSISRDFNRLQEEYFKLQARLDRHRLITIFLTVLLFVILYYVWKNFKVTPQEQQNRIRVYKEVKRGIRNRRKPVYRLLTKKIKQKVNARVGKINDVLHSK